VNAATRTSVENGAALFLLFTLVATAVDAVWVRLGVIVYTTPVVGGQAWWAPLQYGSAALVLVLALRRLAPRSLVSAQGQRDPRTDVIISGTLFVAAQLTGGVLDSHAAWATGTILMMWCVRLLLEGPIGAGTVLLLAACASVAVGGTVAEIVIGALGLMQYRHRELRGVPFWLPALWLQAGVLGRDIVRVWFRPGPVASPDRP
jgi:hypothetical protein